MYTHNDPQNSKFLAVNIATGSLLDFRFQNPIAHYGKKLVQPSLQLGITVLKLKLGNFLYDDKPPYLYRRILSSN